MYFPSLKDLAIAFRETPIFFSLTGTSTIQPLPFSFFCFSTRRSLSPLTSTHSQTCTYTAGQFNGILYEQLAGR